jgi:hypothetical protein
MKYIKEFNDKKILPKVGDYVILNVEKFIDIIDIPSIPNFIDFIGNNVGRIIDTRRMISTEYKLYDVKFDSNHTYLNMNNVITGLSLNEFEYWSPNLDEVELYLNSKKYNL